LTLELDAEIPFSKFSPFLFGLAVRLSLVIRMILSTRMILHTHKLYCGEYQQTTRSWCLTTQTTLPFAWGNSNSGASEY
jgi:hypothetical protein